MDPTFEWLCKLAGILESFKAVSTVCHQGEQCFVFTIERVGNRIFVTKFESERS